MAKLSGPARLLAQPYQHSDYFCQPFQRVQPQPVGPLKDGIPLFFIHTIGYVEDVIVLFSSGNFFAAKGPSANHSQPGLAFLPSIVVLAKMTICSIDDCLGRYLESATAGHQLAYLRVPRSI